MRCLSVCSGIGAPEVAWSPLGWRFIAGSDIEPFPNAVRAHHFPDVPNWGDMTKFRDWPDAAVDLLVGGTPCQSFSVAGLRKGLADPRGNLALTFLAIADRYAPRWIVWENVPGVLSSNGGRDFGAFLAGLGQCGYGWAYRILDAQYFGVPQRRRRVFVVGYLGDWRPAAAVLFERHSLSGHPAPRREKGEGVAGSVAPSLTSNGDAHSGFRDHHGLIASTGDISHCLNAGGMERQDYETETLIAHPLLAKGNSSHDATKETYVAHSLRGEGFDASEDGTGRGTPHHGSHANAGGQVAVAFQTSGYGASVDEIASTMQASYDRLSNQVYGAIQGAAVRRLTPRECERLQGFPDDYTLIPFRGKPAADGPRYKALGNSMAVPVVRWLGERIALIEELLSERNAA